MIDTVRASIQVPLNATEVFGQRSMSVQVSDDNVFSRYWMNPPEDSGLPRLTYYASPPKGPRLVVEFSCIRLVHRYSMKLLSSHEVGVAYQVVDDYLNELGIVVPPLREWRCSRVDYYWQWDVGDLVNAYMEVLQNIRITGYSRAEYEADGVAFRNLGKRAHRRVKFYDTLKHHGHLDGGLIRFEVSNHRSAIRDIAKRIERINPTVGDLSQEDVVRGRLRHWVKRLGLDRLGERSGKVVDRALLLDAFGTRGVSQAMYFLDVYQEHGIKAIERGLLTHSQYYRWKKKCIDANVLNVSAVPLRSLVIT